MEINFLRRSLGIFSTETLVAVGRQFPLDLTAASDLRWTVWLSGTALTSLEQWWSLLLLPPPPLQQEIPGNETQFSHPTHESSAELDRPSIPLRFTWSSEWEFE